MQHELELPSGALDRRAFSRLPLYQFVYSRCGLVLGLACVVGGVLLFLHGVAGTSNWTGKPPGADSQVSDAAPGAILFVVGLFVVLASRFNVRVTPRGAARNGAGRNIPDDAQNFCRAMTSNRRSNPPAIALLPFDAGESLVPLCSCLARTICV